VEVPAKSKPLRLKTTQPDWQNRDRRERGGMIWEPETLRRDRRDHAAWRLAHVADR
jgi:hypothetical protein